MAGRYPKLGLDYFPLSGGFSLTPPIRKIRAATNWKGQLVILELFDTIFCNRGYYLEWTEDTIENLVIRCEGLTQQRKLKEFISEVVKAAIKYGVFDKNAFERCNILTSWDIQHTWLIATRKRTKRYVVRDYWISSAPSAEEMEFMAEEMRQRKGNKIYFINKDGISSSDLIAQYESGTDSAVRSSSGGEKPVEGGENGKQNSPGEILINYRQYQQSKRFEGQVFTSIVKSASIRFHHASHSEIEEMLAIFINRQIIIKSKDDTAENITMHFINWLEKQKPTKNEPTAPKKGVNPNKSTGYKTGTYSNGSDIKSDI